MASRYLRKFPIPNTVPDLFYNFAKEILSYQPEDIVEFGFLYLQAMENVSLLSNLNREKDLNMEA